MKRPEWAPPVSTQAISPVVKQHFPTITENNNRKKKKSSSTTKSIVTPTEIVSKSTTSTSTTTPPVFENINYNVDKHENETFTPQELTHIFHEIIEIATTINSKADQLEALMNLATKYLT